MQWLETGILWRNILSSSILVLPQCIQITYIIMAGPYLSHFSNNLLSCRLPTYSLKQSSRFKYYQVYSVVIYTSAMCSGRIVILLLVCALVCLVIKYKKKDVRLCKLSFIQVDNQIIVQIKTIQLDLRFCEWQRFTSSVQLAWRCIWDKTWNVALTIT